jgi:cytochrome oxidase Cu insertion factor (SCO1/SenC/PrrC family)
MAIQRGAWRVGWPRRGRAALTLACGVAGIGLGSLLAIATHHTVAGTSASLSSRQSVPSLLRKQAAPPFTLVDQDGATVSLAAQKGRVVLLTFMDPVCTALCPVMGRDIAAVEQKLPNWIHPELLIVSVAPGRTNADVEHFLSINLSSTAWLSGWHWLLGPNAASLELTWLHWRVEVSPTPTDINHDEILDVIDPHGYLRATFPAPLPVDDVVSAIATVART